MVVRVRRFRSLVVVGSMVLIAASLGGCPTPGSAGDLIPNQVASAMNNPAAAGATGGAAQALVGVWRASFVDPTFGPGQVEMILMANGRFQQQTVYQAGALVTIFGTFRVFPDNALLRLDIERGEPAETCGPLGCTPIRYPAGESYGYSLVGPNDLLLQNVNCVPGTGAVCDFAYVREG